MTATIETGDEQIRTMRDLRQAAASWLLGYKSSRSIRDCPDIPRTASGGYDASELLQWARGRWVQRPELSDDDLERVLQCIEWTAPEAARCLLEMLDELRRRFGDGGLLVYLSENMAYLRRLNQEPIATTPPPDTLPYDEERELIEGEIRRRRESWHWERLRIRYVCESCGRMRHGRKWVQAEPGHGVPFVKGTCPACESNRPRHGMR